MICNYNYVSRETLCGVSQKESPMFHVKHRTFPNSELLSNSYGSQREQSPVQIQGSDREQRLL